MLDRYTQRRRSFPREESVRLQTVPRDLSSDRRKTGRFLSAANRRILVRKERRTKDLPPFSAASYHPPLPKHGSVDGLRRSGTGRPAVRDTSCRARTVQPSTPSPLCRTPSTFERVGLSRGRLSEGVGYGGGVPAPRRERSTPSRHRGRKPSALPPSSPHRPLRNSTAREDRGVPLRRDTVRTSGFGACGEIRFANKPPNF